MLTSLYDTGLSFAAVKTLAPCKKVYPSIHMYSTSFWLRRRKLAISLSSIHPVGSTVTCCLLPIVSEVVLLLLLRVIDCGNSIQYCFDT